MASVWRDTRTRGKPVWCILYKGLDGKWHRERTEAQTKDQAQRVLRGRLDELAEAKLKGFQTLERQKPVTFERFVDDEYLPAKAPPVRRASSHSRDKTLFKTVKPHFAQMLLGAISVQEIERYMAKRKVGKTWKGTPPSPAQLNRERQFLGSVLGMAKRFGFVDRNPIEDVKKLREDNSRDRVLSLDEEGDILEQAPEFARPFISLALATGMRLGEIVGLRWADVDRKDGEAVHDGFIRIGSESKGHRIRYVPINAAVKEILDSQKPVATEDGFVPFVFVNLRFKKPYRQFSVGHAFTEAAVRAKVDGVTFHVTRHTAVSRMVAAGVPDRIIMKVVGHTTPNMVSRYTHLAPSNLKGATDCLAGTGSYKGRTNPSHAIPPRAKLLASNGPP